jgi:hypothetical protein
VSGVVFLYFAPETSRLYIDGSRRLCIHWLRALRHALSLGAYLPLEAAAAAAARRCDGELAAAKGMSILSVAPTSYRPAKLGGSFSHRLLGFAPNKALLSVTVSFVVRLA